MFGRDMCRLSSGKFVQLKTWWWPQIEALGCWFECNFDSKAVVLFIKKWRWKPDLTFDSYKASKSVDSLFLKNKKFPNWRENVMSTVRQARCTNFFWKSVVSATSSRFWFLFLFWADYLLWFFPFTNGHSGRSIYQVVFERRASVTKKRKETESFTFGFFMGEIIIISHIFTGFIFSRQKPHVRAFKTAQGRDFLVCWAM